MSDLDWDWTFAWSILPDLVRATGHTLLVAFISFAGALLVGLPLALGRNSASAGLRVATGGFVEFVRGTPLLIQIYFLYFVLPSAGLVLPALATGVIALSLHYGAYLCEVYRAGIASVPAGQSETARALGLSARLTFFRIVLPQAVRPVLPTIGNYLISLFKETPLLSAIAIIELLQRAKLLGSEHFRYTEPFTIVGAIFLVISLIASFGLRRFENWFGSGRPGMKDH